MEEDMIGGTFGKILHVNLTSGEVRVEQPSDDIYRLLVGGRALVAYLLLRDLPTGIDPLGPDNLFIVAPGIMQGTNLPGAGRHGMGAKSPLTGALGSSDVGGFFGHEFKRAGYDALVVHGRAQSPVYLWIKDGEVDIRPANHLWGKTTAPVQDAIREELGDDRIRVAQIGPAGENQVLYANVIHDVNRAAGRNGMGAVMGSKNLKAIAVRGTMELAIADRDAVREVAGWLRENYKDRMGWATAGIGRGTQDSLMNWGYRGGLPTHNFGKAVFENRHLLSGERNYEMYLKERDTCQACPARCKQVFEHESDDPDRRLDPVYGGAEYEAMAAFGPCCGVEDNFAVLKANELANAYGLDSISTGMSIAFVMECFEEGILTSEDTGGIEYGWGKAEVLAPTIKMIAHREGFGDIMAEGTARMGRRFGPETAPFTLTTKGQELPMHEPRLKHVMGIGYAINPIGAEHMINVHDTDFEGEGWMLDRVNAVMEEKLDPLPPDELSEEKMQILFHEVNFMHCLDCALICFFYCYDYHHVAEALSGVTGESYTVQDIMDVGKRANTLARLFNYREGLTAEDDTLPKRVMEPFAEGPIAGSEITEEELEWAIHRYYELMGWDRDTGEPTKACLQDLKLEGLLS
jgi:aldehyde:ferredoxin oxidoreductase